MLLTVRVHHGGQRWFDGDEDYGCGARTNSQSPVVLVEGAMKEMDVAVRFVFSNAVGMVVSVEEAMVAVGHNFAMILGAAGTNNGEAK